jgi:hypothetical protein
MVVIPRKDYLTPLIPLSDFNDKIHTKIRRSERGRVFERGLRPLSLRLPLLQRGV